MRKSLLLFRAHITGIVTYPGSFNKNAYSIYFLVFLVLLILKKSVSFSSPQRMRDEKNEAQNKMTEALSFIITCACDCDFFFSLLSVLFFFVFFLIIIPGKFKIKEDDGFGTGKSPAAPPQKNRAGNE